MICPRCFFRAGSRGLRAPAAATNSSVRAFTTTRAASAKAPTTDAAKSASPNSPATSTSAAQPLSTPLTASPSVGSVGKPSKPSSPPVLVQSSVPAGTPLKGLNFYKNKTDPVAMEDSEYPPWLWTVLKPEGKKEEAVEGDLFCRSSTRFLFNTHVS
ncbi:Ribosomal protein L37 mitochondrial [Macrophomina phaseolina MS6]|uniref:Large ribosomal subunit protein mL54 n=1 Tax=Macrophomina phaseolina (strain MS6) TaxID=1126212 RepID=K2R8K8_MACPH|nr:Ribosomal protein L37 mitochondrial [Macrophomina phaseolina MS6]